MKQRSLALALSLPLLSVSFFGCAAEDDDDEMAATTASLHAEGLSSDALDALDSNDPAKAAEAAAKAAPGDQGCRTRVLDVDDPTVVHVHLVKCPKGFGRHVLDGEVRLAFSAAPSGALHVERQSVGLSLDGQPAELGGSADIVFDRDLRRIRAKSLWTTTSPDGAVRVRTGEHQVTVDTTTRCRVSTGEATTTEDGAPFAASTSELSYCRLDDGTDTCPTGLVEHERTNGKHVTKHFDGSTSAVATITRKHGDPKTKRIPLFCSPR